MQLVRLALKNFRNLRDIDIHFAEHFEAASTDASDAPRAIRSNALIGQNGTGKSNLMEALITIFGILI